MIYGKKVISQQIKKYVSTGVFILHNTRYSIKSVKYKRLQSKVIKNSKYIIKYSKTKYKYCET